MFLIDSHCHIDSLISSSNFSYNLKDIMETCFLKNVKFILGISTTLSQFKHLKNLVNDYSNIAISCGVHPLYQKEIDSLDYHSLYKLSLDKKVIAIGETGLDYFHSSDRKKQQQSAFYKHLDVSYQLKKPVIIHARNSYTDILSILKKEKIENFRGIMHCFNGNKSIASKFLDIGMYLSFSGIVTFKNSEQLRETIKYIPTNRILIETDAPYLAPEPFRGKTNHPAHVVEIANCIAKIKNMNVKNFADIVKKNFTQLFNISYID
ncbi:TatD family hydrolase [Candidatus Tachikawaea gelatinosa]|uniref:Putative deoxyribonuclease n=1 Tax=Candidatus Tachikawaea gelatinosa TaxID=1410383 RepID=A0A090BWL4_9ENTR|nr:TatD family hydrolase [Candidatus Tachikawaea gelatinosa]BAP58811.1 putative deoxyribonuclease [Candidatus Tachikawaea gelatinosa]